jgi:hypothetical protein
LALIEVLDQFGPVTVALDASSPIFASYNSGDLTSVQPNFSIGYSKIYINLKLRLFILIFSLLY